VGKSHRICKICEKAYYGQGKYCCSTKCANIYKTGKILNISENERKRRSNSMSLRTKNIKLSDSHKNKIGKSSELHWKNDIYREKMHKSRMGHEVAQETRDKIRKSQKGRKNPWTTEHNKNRIPPSGWHHSEISKQITRDKVSGNKNGQYGKAPPIVKGVKFIDRKGRLFKFRSKWEEKLAIYFDKNNIDWEYEKTTYKLSDNSTYTPDFFIEEMIYEVKGYPYKRSIEKFECFKKEYSHLKITLANRQYFTKILKIKL
jgi:hypothetical protein